MSEVGHCTAWWCAALAEAAALRPPFAVGVLPARCLGEDLVVLVVVDAFLGFCCLPFAGRAGLLGGVVASLPALPFPLPPRAGVGLCTTVLLLPAPFLLPTLSSLRFERVLVAIVVEEGEPGLRTAVVAVLDVDDTRPLVRDDDGVAGRDKVCSSSR